MPCDMGMGSGSGFDPDAHRRIAELEQAMCGLCQTFVTAGVPLHPQLAAWFEKHQRTPGCEAGTGAKPT